MIKKLTWLRLGILKYLVFSTIVVISLTTACSKDDEIIEDDEEVLADDPNEESETTEEDDDSEESESESDEDDDSTDEETDTDEGEETTSDEEDDSGESDESDDQSEDSEFSVSLSDEDFDAVYKPSDKIYIDLENIDLTGINRIKIVGYLSNKWFGLQTQETHDKFILVDVSNSSGQVAVGGQNNTIVIIGMESSSSKKLVAFDDYIQGGQVTKAQGNVYIELLPTLSDRINDGTRILVYLGSEEDISDEEATEQLQRVLDNNVFEDTGWL